MKSLFALCLLAIALPAFAQDIPYDCTCQVVAKPTGTLPPPISPPVEPPKLGMKWHPGHYTWLDRNNSTPEIRAEHFRQIALLANEPTIKGIKLAIYWAHLEGVPGDYSAGFQIIDEYLTHLSKANKQLMLSVQDRAFGNYGTNLAAYVPAYIVTGSSYGMTKMANGITARVWQAPTTDRLIALSKALAARYDPHPNFEMYQTEETAVSVGTGTDGYSYASHGAQIQRLMVESRKAWPTTHVRLSANFFGSDSQMLELLKFCDLIDITVGGPDVIPTQTIQANRMYEANLLGQMVWASEIQSPSLGGHKGTFTPQQLYDSAMKQRPSYIVWYRNTWSGGAEQKWDTGILPFIRSISGRVVSTCPVNVVCTQ